MERKPTILLVEDQEILRLGLKISLERMNIFDIVGEAGDGETAVKKAQQLHPDVILMDVGIPRLNGIEATWKIKQELPRTKIVMITSHTTREDVVAALGAGADGYCTKSTSVEQIVFAINAVMRGETWLDSEIAGAVVEGQVAESDSIENALSISEMKILTLLQEGKSNTEIATQLNASKEKIARVLQKIIHRYSEKDTAQGMDQKSISEGTNQWLAHLPENLTQGSVFADKYLVGELLGTGGLGAVFKAKHLYMERFVALKLLSPEYFENRRVIRNFQREAMAIANINHKNIVGVYDFGISQKKEPYLIMEYVEGTNLDEIMEKANRLPPRRIIDICLQVCDGLIEAHSKGVIHCDLKPSNILILDTNPESVKLVDFGLAQVLPREIKIDSQRTDSLLVSGTPTYMSLEQCEGKPLDARSDIYSLGCILHEALTGVAIFECESSMKTFLRHFNMEVPTLISTYPQGQFSSELEHCVHKMLEREKDKRPQTMEEVRTLLLAASVTSNSPSPVTI